LSTKGEPWALEANTLRKKVWNEKDSIWLHGSGGRNLQLSEKLSTGATNLLENAKTELFYGFSGYSVLNEGNGMKLQLKNPTHNAIDFSIESGTWW
jgi:hypothetical protein